MRRPVIETKLYVPEPRRGLVTRPRLGEQLRRGADARLTLVSAPAGFGKTTLVAEWLGRASRADRRVAWLSLDASDNEPASFWTYLVTALQTAVPGVGSDALEIISSVPLPTEHLLTSLLNDLATTADGLWLVLDDYHLIDSHDIRDGMTFLLEHLPPHVHVVLCTRADPDLALSRWRVRGELVEIRAADLRFTIGEAAAYLNDASGLDLTEADVAALEERTEGWIAALQLAALSIQGREDVGGFIARFSGNDRYVVDYLVEEVLAHQTDTVRNFLLHTAVLQQLTGPLCDAITGRTDGGDILADLERANLFLVALDDRREWYRYHHLFADMLQARVRSEQPEQIPLLHQRASRWYAAHDLVEDAVGHALAASDFDGAAYLMELAVPSIRRHRREAILHGWLTALPDEVLRRSPVLSVFCGHLLMVSGDLDAVEPRLDDAERVLAAVPDGLPPPGADTEDLRTLPAVIAVYRAALAQARGDVAGTAEHARRALDLTGPSDHLARGAAAGLLGFAAWAQGDVSTALRTFAQAVTSLHAAGNLVDELSGTVALADMWLAAGRPNTARRLYQRALRVAEAHGEPVARATAELHVGLSEIDCEAGDLPAARRHLASAAVFVERGLMNESRYRWFVAMGRLTDAEGDPEQAISLLDQAEQLYRPGFFPDVRPIAAIRARVWMSQGKLAEAAEWAAERGVRVTDDVGYLSEFDHLTLVRLILERHRAHRDPGGLAEAGALLDRLRVAAQASGRAGSVAEIRQLQALLRGAQHHGREQDAAMLVTAPLSGREVQVLRLLDTDLSGPQIARELFVSHNTLRTHTKHIFTKLEVTSRRGAVHRARERGLL